MAWTPMPLPEDPDEIIRRIITGIAARIPGWKPHEGALETALAEEIGLQIGALHQATTIAFDYAAAGIAKTLGFEPVDGIQAVLPEVQLVAQFPPSAAIAPFERAVTVPAGFKIAVGEHAYTIPEQVTAVASFTQATETGYEGYWRGSILVDFLAIDIGDDYNIGVAGDRATMITSQNPIISATLTTPARGGTNAETLDAFLSRFVAWMSTLKPGGVRASDIATFATTIDGVGRTLALDRYNPANPTTPTDRTVTIIPVAPDGSDLTTLEKQRLTAALEQIREVGFIFHIIDPTRTPVTVDITITPATSSEPEAVIDAVHDALAAALAPDAWGTTDGDPATWTERMEVRVLDIALVAATVPGVAALGEITLNGGGSDTVALTGPGALIAPTIQVALS